MSEIKEKTYNTKPTAMQKQAFNKMVENGGNKASALKSVGYSSAVVNNPSKVTESKGWKQLEEEYLPQDKIAKIISEGMEATKSGFEYKEVEVKDENGNMKTEIKKVVVKVKDWHAIHRFVDTACKLRGMYPKENKIALIESAFSLADLAEKSHRRKQMGLPPITAIK
jgi:hypothetical protein